MKDRTQVIQALNSSEGILILDYLKEICGANKDTSYVVGDQLTTIHNEGKRSVYMEISKLAKRKSEDLTGTNKSIYKVNL